MSDSREESGRPGAVGGPGVAWSEVTARRLARHRLDAPAPVSEATASERIADVVAAMCGAHAQIMSAAEVSVALRVDGVDRRRVREALWTDRSLVKVYGPRGTVHLVPARDLPMWSGALTAASAATRRSGRERLLTDDQVEALAAALPRVLADAELTTDELTDVLATEAGPWAADPVMEAFGTRWPRWRWAQHLLGHRGALCFGPDRGRRVTYTSPARWLPGFVPMDPEPAARRLALRYLHSYGPATAGEFAHWLAAPARWGEEVFRTLGGAVEPVHVLGSGLAWQVAGDPVHTEPPRGLRLLPYFDVFGVGSHPRSRLFAGRAAERALHRGQAGNYPLLLVDGQVGGVWHQVRSGRRLRITVEPLTPLRAGLAAELAAQADRLAEIQEMREAELTVGPVSVGPHA
ncbi:winged helix DNA-binding domain-containing protein [Streptomyces otsuchiensis]|uniref:winged helix DNA-binding domain-containing protein n=1 Tax=Streptomyces otsuchiensis TaxID=2681388 RepID=UPI00102FD4DD|nr:winged helix DNA-binding domain-containing protein [Streptomyces otsuchiensis]